MACQFVDYDLVPCPRRVKRCFSLYCVALKSDCPVVLLVAVAMRPDKRFLPLPELLVQWWARQLTLCGWPEVGDPRQAIPRDLALERLAAFGIGDRDEFAWRLWESITDTREPALSRLAALELLALGSVTEWSDRRAVMAWLVHLARAIIVEYPSLQRWVDELSRLDDPVVNAAARDLVEAERQGRGVAWAALKRRVREYDAETTETLWNDDLWRARAAFAPVLYWPFSPDESESRKQRRLLREELEIEGRNHLIETLYWLACQGHRHGWEMDAVRLAREGASAAREWLASLEDQQDYGRVLVRFLNDGEPLEWAAWDWLRLIDQAYLGFCAGWLTAEETENFAAHAVDLLQQRYTDWRAVANAYQRGRSLFEGRDLRPDFATDWARLLEASASPWGRPLADSLDEKRRLAARQAMQKRHASPDAWILAMASVREPDLVQRCRLDEELGMTRRQEAERYLRDVLGLRREEGLSGLARFWMPAQAHHLNQLAADALHAVGVSSSGGDGGRQKRLAACANHAATIVMAEKYAFYLLMAADSGRYSQEEIQGQVQSLCDVLSRFYSDPSRLLAAWSAWEAVLSQEDAPEEGSLKDDIDWHLRDPGSRFHWLTPSQELTWQEPGPRPTLAQFTAIALAGPLNEAAWQIPQPLALEDRLALQEWIEHQYALQGASGLVEFLNFLAGAGDRQEYQINYAPYTLNRPRLEEEIAILESGECAEEERIHLLRLRRVRDNACRCNDEDLTAWDIAQLVDLAMAGRQLDWLDAGEFTHYLEVASRLAEKHYGSWQAYAEGLYSGFGFFMDDTPERETFLVRFREALDAWLTATPLLAGSWASLDFPGQTGRHWTPFHVDVLPGEPHRLH